MERLPQVTAVGLGREPDFDPPVVYARHLHHCGGAPKDAIVQCWGDHTCDARSDAIAMAPDAYDDFRFYRFGYARGVSNVHPLI